MGLNRAGLEGIGNLGEEEDWGQKRAGRIEIVVMERATTERMVDQVQNLAAFALFKYDKWLGACICITARLDNVPMTMCRDRRWIRIGGVELIAANDYVTPCLCSLCVYMRPYLKLDTTHLFQKSSLPSKLICISMLHLVVVRYNE